MKVNCITSPLKQRAVPLDLFHLVVSVQFACKTYHKFLTSYVGSYRFAGTLEEVKIISKGALSPGPKSGGFV